MAFKNPGQYKAGLLFGGLFGVLLSLSACTPLDNDPTGSKIWVPWMGVNGKYQFQRVPVSTVTHWSPLRGTAANLRSNAKLTPDGKYLISQEVTFEHSVDQSGTVIPMTRAASEVAAIYAHFERFQKQDQELGLPEANRPRKVFVKYQESVGQGFVLVNNAFYDAISNAFFILPYEREGLPLSVNGSVLAHEHFHSIFARLLFRPLIKQAESKGKKLFDYKELSPHLQDFGPRVLHKFGLTNPPTNKELQVEEVVLETEWNEKNRRIFLNRAMFVALNEGLADVWGWFYGQDPCFMIPSYGKSLGQRRCLNVDIGQLQMKGTETLNKNYYPFISKETQSLEQGYDLGSNLARLIHLRMYDQEAMNAPEVRVFWSKRIVETLPTFIPQMVDVLVEDSIGKVVLDWESMVDTLLFGPGSVPVPADHCERWRGILKVNAPMPNFHKHCPN